MASRKKGGVCQICGTAYKHASMAMRCQKTLACRLWHAPGGMRKRAFEVQIGVGELIGYYCEPMTRAKYPQIAELGTRTLRHVDDMVGNLVTMGISDTIFSKMDHAITDVILELWPLGKEFDVVHMIAVTSNLIEDLKSELRTWFSLCPDHKEAWEKLEHDIDELYAVFDPEAEENYPSAERVAPCYQTLRKHIFGPEVLAPKLKGYKVGIFWVAAFSKQEARELVRREFGLVKQQTQGLHPDMKFDDGATLSSILKSTQEPSIIGKEA